MHRFTLEPLGLTSLILPLLVVPCPLRAGGPATQDPSTMADLARRMALGLRYLYRSIDPSGRFICKRGPDATPQGTR